MAETPRRCYWVTGDHDEEGYWPSIVVEGQLGSWPMLNPSGDRPWYWGGTLVEAAEVCREANAVDFGLSESEVFDIVATIYRT